MTIRTVLPALGFPVYALLAVASPAAAEDAALTACVNVQTGVVRVVSANTSCRATERGLPWPTPDENVVRVAAVGSGANRTAVVPELGTVTAWCETTGAARVRVDSSGLVAIHSGAGAAGTLEGLKTVLGFSPVIEPGVGAIRPSNLWATVMRTDTGVIWRVDVTLHMEAVWVVGGLGGTEHVIPCAATASVTRMN